MNIHVEQIIYSDGGKIAQTGDKIKITLKTEEVIIGEFSDFYADEITITRNESDWTFEVEDIEDIERV